MSSSDLKDYILLEKIGNGSYATVYKAFRKANKRNVVAIKCVETTKLSKSAIDNIVTEINLLKVLKHEHIVEMEDFFWDASHIYIVMEYCDGGDLSHYIKKKTQLPETVCQKFLQQLALALKYLYSHKVCHLDLKPQNLLLTKKPVLRLKVGDFGFAQYLSTSESAFNVRGSPLYMAPEILLHHRYDARADLWSVGVIMYECLYGKAPYSSNSLQQLVEKIRDCQSIQLPAACHVSPKCKDLLMSLLKQNPDERISFDDFFSHEFLNLAYAPTRENYEKAIELIRLAVKADTQGTKQEAFHLYCEALRYFIPQLTNEADPMKKIHLRNRINEYLNRAEKLKRPCLDIDNSAGYNKHSEKQIQQNYMSNHSELRVLSKSTADLGVALEMGETGEQYLAEGNWELALEKLTSCLGILMRIIDKEPPGRRRTLIHQQTTIWMKKAEYVKDILSMKTMEESTRRNETEHDQCLLQ